MDKKKELEYYLRSRYLLGLDKISNNGDILKILEDNLNKIHNMLKSILLINKYGLPYIIDNGEGIKEELNKDEKYYIFRYRGKNIIDRLSTVDYNGKYYIFIAFDSICLYNPLTKRIILDKEKVDKIIDERYISEDVKKVSKGNKHYFKVYRANEDKGVKNCSIYKRVTGDMIWNTKIIKGKNIVYDDEEYTVSYLGLEDGYSIKNIKGDG